jgi:hypothetical protein
MSLNHFNELFSAFFGIFKKILNIPISRILGTRRYHVIPGIHDVAGSFVEGNSDFYVKSLFKLFYELDCALLCEIVEVSSIVANYDSLLNLCFHIEIKSKVISIV